MYHKVPFTVLRHNYALLIEDHNFNRLYVILEREVREVQFSCIRKSVLYNITEEPSKISRQVTVTHSCSHIAAAAPCLICRRVVPCVCVSCRGCLGGGGRRTSSKIPNYISIYGSYANMVFQRYQIFKSHLFTEIGVNFQQFSKPFLACIL